MTTCMQSACVHGRTNQQWPLSGLSAYEIRLTLLLAQVMCMHTVCTVANLRRDRAEHVLTHRQRMSQLRHSIRPKSMAHIAVTRRRKPSKVVGHVLWARRGRFKQRWNTLSWHWFYASNRITQMIRRSQSSNFGTANFRTPSDCSPW